MPVSGYCRHAYITLTTGPGGSENSEKFVLLIGTATDGSRTSHEVFEVPLLPDSVAVRCRRCSQAEGVHVQMSSYLRGEGEKNTRMPDAENLIDHR